MKRFIGLFLLVFAAAVGWIALTTIVAISKSAMTATAPIALAIALAWFGIQLIRSERP